MGIIIDILGDISLSYADFNSFKPEVMAEKINSVIGTVDYRIADLESPFCTKESEAPITKSGPNLKMQENSIPFFEKLDVDGYTLANNHLGDFGETGIINTIEVLEKLKKDYVGSAKEYAQVYCPLRKTIKGIKISFISVCENEFGTAHDNRIGTADFDKERMKNILTLESQWADIKLIIFHGGTEYYPYPTPDEKCRYHDLADMGADAVIGMHSHCPKGFEIYHGVPIIYSVGNFFFPGKFETPFPNWKVGYVARLIFQKKKEITVNIVPYKFDIYGRNFWAVDKEYFGCHLDNISKAIQDEQCLNILYRAWVTISGKNYFEKMCECVKCMSDRKNLATVKNIFSCEAHNELLKTYLDLCYENKIEEYSKYTDVIKQYMRFSGEENLDEEVNKNVLNKADIVIWGISKRSELLYHKIYLEGNIMFADKDPLKQGLLFCGRFIISPEEVISKYKSTEIYICTAENSALEIKKLLKENHMNWKEYQE